MFIQQIENLLLQSKKTVSYKIDLSKHAQLPVSGAKDNFRIFLFKREQAERKRKENRIIFRYREIQTGYKTIFFDFNKLKSKDKKNGCHPDNQSSLTLNLNTMKNTVQMYIQYVI